MKFPGEITVGIVSNMGIFEVDSEKTGPVNVTGGLESRFLDMLADGLKFKYTAVIPQDRQWGKPANGAWTGIIGMVYTQKVDIGLSKLGITYDKSTYVDFSYPYTAEDLTFATKTPGYLSKETAIVFPFSSGVWLSLFVTMILACFVFQLLLSKEHGFVHKAMYVFGSVLMKSVKIRSKRLRERLLIVFWLSGTMILSYSYVALLLSFLTLPLRERPITDKRELSTAVDRGSYKCMMSKGSHLFTVLKNSDDEYLVNLAHKMVDNDWFIPPNKKAIAETLRFPKTAVIAPKNDFRFMLQSTIYISRDSIMPMYWGIAVNKKFCCKGALDAMIHRVVAAGLYLKSERDFYFRLQLINSLSVPEDENNIKKLTLSDVSGAAIFLAMGYVLSIVALLVEILGKKLNKKV